MATASSTTTPPAAAAAGEWKARFDRDVRVLGVSVEPKKVGEIVAKLKPHHLLLDRAKLRPVIPDTTDPARKLILLSDTLHSLSGIADATARDYLQKLVSSGSGVLRENVTVHVDWTHYTVKEILAELLNIPAGVGVEGTSFETIGHIAHVNLPDAQLPHKHLIGDVLLQKNSPRIRTVVNKTGNITNEFRTFPMEVIAGDSSTMETTVSEYGCTFKLNYAEVYWNSKLEGEHSRLVDTFLRTDLVADAFAGIGPFAIPAAVKHNVRVLANDLNPRSAEYCRINARENGVDHLVTVFNLDARDFLRAHAGRGSGVTRVVMNLPADAVLFLDVMGDLARAGAWSTLKEAPVVHCYSFTRNVTDPLADLIARAKQAIGEGAEPVPVADGEIKGVKALHDVRDVAPNKRMFCLSIRVMPTSTAAAPPMKKQCCDSASTSTTSSTNQ